MTKVWHAAEDELYYVCTCTVPPFTTAPPRHSSEYCPVTWNGNEFSLIYIWMHELLPLPSRQVISTDLDSVSDTVLNLLVRCPAVCIQAHVPPGNSAAPKHYQIYMRVDIVHTQLALQGYFEGQAVFLQALHTLRCSMTIESHRVRHWARPPTGALPPATPARNDTLVPWQRQLRPAQIAAVEWMQTLELSHGIQLRFDPRIPITPTVAVDTAKCIMLSCTGILSDVKITRCRVGILSGDRGIGKTSAMLGLAMSAACNPLNVPLTDAHEMACLIANKATLIVIPRHLLTTWKMEIQACCPGANVVYMCNSAGCGNSVADIDALLNAQLVVTTAKYLRHHTSFAFLANYDACDDISIHTQSYIKHTLGTRPHPAFMQTLPLDLFKWRRIIVDEAFENQTRVGLKSDFLWCVGANVNRMHASRLLACVHSATGYMPAERDWTASATATFNTYCTHNIFTSDEGLPLIIDVTRYVELHPVENMRYESAVNAEWSRDRLIKLCCGLTPEEPGQFMLPAALPDILAAVQDTHEATMRALELDAALFVHGQRYDDVRHVREDEEMAHRRFQGVAERMASPTEPPDECPVCYMNNSTISTTCAHTFCWACMYRVFANSADAPCPICRRLLGRKRDVHQLRSATEPEHGAKVNALLSLLDDIPKDESVAVFVSWHSIAQALQAAIPGSSCKVVTNKNADATLADFSGSLLPNYFLNTTMTTADNAATIIEAPARVLILTFQQCHGLSLTRANHAIFYHPARFGTVEEDSAVSCLQREGQTRTVHVHRLVVKGAVECERFC